MTALFLQTIIKDMRDKVETFKAMFNKRVISLVDNQKNKFLEFIVKNVGVGRREDERPKVREDVEGKRDEEIAGENMPEFKQEK